MLTADKTFGSFNRPQKPFSFVRVDGVLNVFAVRQQLKIFQPVVRAVQIFMIDLHSLRNRAYKGLPHHAVNRDSGVFSIFAWAEPNVVVARNARFDRTSAAVADPRFAVLNVERRGNAGVEKSSYGAQRGTFGKHIFCRVNLFRVKQLSSRYAPNTRKIADLVKTFVIADWFPNLHAVNVKPLHVESQP